MTPVVEPGKFAGWIAPPARGINSQPVEFEYVKLSVRAGEEGRHG
jgi:benzoyl-CoA 2,3-dioxygenase component B